MCSGAPRIHGELLKLGFVVAQSIIAKYMPRKVTRPVRAGAPSCAIICHTSRRWICWWSRPSASTCSKFWSLSDWLDESLSGST
jgi:hypothetical protein